MRTLRRMLPLLLIGATFLAAQTKAEMDRDEAEVMAHRLSMNTLNKVLQGSRNLLEALKADPALARRLEQKSQENEAAGGDSNNGRILITRAQRSMESEPKVVAAYKNAGLTIREGIVAPAAFAMYGLAAYSAKNGKAPDIKGLLPENLTFLRDNEAEIRQIGTEMQKVAKEMNALTAPKEEQDADEEEEQPSKTKK